MTFSIVARSADGESWGVAVASKFLAVGSVVPAAVAGVGAIATQADANVAYKGLALAHLDDGATASVALAAAARGGRRAATHRQVGIVDVDGGAATHTGHACLDWAGGVTGDGYAIQGNILAGEVVVAAMQDAWRRPTPTSPLARRLLAALAAGDDAGGDRRGRQSAALLVVTDGRRVRRRRRHRGRPAGRRPPDPVTELARLLDLNDLYLTASTDERAGRRHRRARAPSSSERVHELGLADLNAWVGTENYEMRVDADGAWIDQQILDDSLRATTRSRAA